jgi:hypothetical protein
MSLSHYLICLPHASVTPGDIPAAWNDQINNPVSQPNCGSPTSTAARVYLRPYETVALETEQFADGMLIGWGVVAAMAIAWTIQYLRRAL